MNEFETLIATRRDGALNRSLVESLNVAPSQAAEIENFAAARKLTPDIARENLPQLKRDALHDEINAADYPRKSPITAEFLSDPSNASVGASDHGVLSQLEGLFRDADYNVELGRTPSIPRRAQAPSLVSVVPEQQDLIQGTVRALGQVLPATNVAASGVIQAVVDPLESITEPMVGTLLPGNPFTTIRESLQRSRQASQGIANLIRGDQTGFSFFEKAALSGVESLAQQLPLMAGAVATRNPELALAGMTGITGGTSYAQARDQGVDSGKALAFAAFQAAVERYTEKNPLTSLLEDIQDGAPLVKTILKNQFAEQAGEAVATTLQDLGEWAVLPENAGKGWQDFVNERPDAFAQTAIATAVQAGIQAPAVALMQSSQPTIDYRREANNLVTAMARSQADQVVLDQAIQLATDSELRKADPIRFVQFMQSAAAGRTVYVTQDEVQKLADAGTTLPPEIVKQLDGSGADVVVTMRDVLANPEIAVQLRDHIRLQPGGFTKGEMGDGKSLVKEMLERAQKQQIEQDENDVIHQQVMAQLVASGRYSEQSARHAAALIPAYVATRAADLGITPTEVYTMMGLTVEGPTSTAEPVPTATPAKTLEQQDVSAAGATSDEEIADARREWVMKGTDSPYFQKWFGESKVRDESGKPLVVYHGGAAGIESFDSTRVGENMGQDREGFFFTNDKNKYPGSAQSYADIVSRGGTPSDVYPVYLDIKKPYTLEQFSEDTGISVEDYLYEQGDLQHPMNALDLNRNDVFRRAKEGGYDGIAFASNLEGADDAVYVAFHPEQVKSAIGNRGTFDSRNPSILAQGIKLTEQVQIAETGETVTIEQDAQRLYDQTTKRLDVLRKIKECSRVG